MVFTLLIVNIHISVLCSSTSMEKGQQGKEKLQEVTIISWELERENKWLKKQVLKLQDDIEREQQEIITIK